MLTFSKPDLTSDKVCANCREFLSTLKGSKKKMDKETLQMQHRRLCSPVECVFVCFFLELHTVCVFSHFFFPLSHIRCFFVCFCLYYTMFLYIKDFLDLLIFFFYCWENNRHGPWLLRAIAKESPVFYVILIKVKVKRHKLLKPNVKNSTIFSGFLFTSKGFNKIPVSSLPFKFNVHVHFSLITLIVWFSFFFFFYEFSSLHLFCFESIGQISKSKSQI